MALLKLMRMLMRDFLLNKSLQNFIDMSIFILKNTLYVCKTLYGDINMNIALRKLAMLEEKMVKEEELAKVQGYCTCPVDQDFKKRVTDLMDRVRVI